MFNKILRNKNYELRMTDFIAIHRNGRKMNGSRPPSVTVKFLRFFEKDMMFDKQVINARQRMFSGVNFFHCLCRGIILYMIQPKGKNYSSYRSRYSVCFFE